MTWSNLANCLCVAVGETREITGSNWCVLKRIYQRQYSGRPGCTSFHFWVNDAQLKNRWLVFVTGPMRPVVFGEALAHGSRLTLFSKDKPDRFFTVIKFWMDQSSGGVLALRGGVPTYQVEDGGSTELAEVLPRRSLGCGGRKVEPIY